VNRERCCSGGCELGLELERPDKLSHTLTLRLKRTGKRNRGTLLRTRISESESSCGFTLEAEVATEARERERERERERKRERADRRASEEKRRKERRGEEERKEEIKRRRSRLE